MYPVFPKLPSHSLLFLKGISTSGLKSHSKLKCIHLLLSPSHLYSCYLIHQQLSQTVEHNAWGTLIDRLPPQALQLISLQHFTQSCFSILLPAPRVVTSLLDNCHRSSLASASCHWAQFSTRRDRTPQLAVALAFSSLEVFHLNSQDKMLVPLYTTY